MRDVLPTVFLLLGGLSALAQNDSVLRYVDPLIGTTQAAVPTRWGSEGGTYPGAVAPFGAVQLSPETRLTPAKEYDYRDTTIRFFSCFQHLSGYPHGSSGRVTVMPVRNAVTFNAATYQRSFSHHTEQAEAGYYRVRFTDDQTLVEATASERVGRFRFTFPAGVVPRLFVGDAGKITVTSSRELRGAYNNTLFLLSRSIIKRENWAGGCLLTVGRAPAGPTVLVLDVSASRVGFASAHRNMAVERGRETFDQTRAQTRRQWARLLSVVRVDDPNEAGKTIFYTALYHSLLLPWIISDTDGQYVGRDGKTHKTTGQNQYDGFSPWDTFRTLHPLLTLLYPDRQTEMIRSMLDVYRQTGHLPGDPMTGNHAIPILVDSYRKGIRFDSVAAYQAMKATLLDSLRPGQDLTAYRQTGYLPSTFSESVTKTVEYAYDDWALAQFARTVMHDEAAYARLQRASYGYRPLFYPQSLFLLPRRGNTFTVKPGTTGYKEGDAWIYSYFVPQHPTDLVNLMGGKRAFTTRLDSALTHGQILFDNETVFHVPYLFSYAGDPAKTQQWVRRIMASRFSDSPGGLPGNDDLGSTSSWYVFSALGLFPITPGRPVYAVGSPVFRSVTLRLANDRTLVINSSPTAPANVFVQSLTVNGQPETRYELTHATLLQGGELRFGMGPTPAPNQPLIQAITDDTEPIEPVAIEVGQMTVAQTTVTPNEPFSVRFTLTNRGGLGTKTIQLLVDGQPCAQKNSLVASGTTMADSIDCRLYAIGPHTVQLAGVPPFIVTVVSARHPADSLAITELTVKPIVRLGQWLPVGYTAQNVGGYPRRFQIPVRLADSLIVTDTITLLPGQRRTINHVLRPGRAGRALVRVHTAKIVVKTYAVNLESTLLALPLTNAIGDSLVTDRSGFANHGRFIHPATSAALTFGDSSYVAVPSSPSLDRLDSTLTMMAWVRPTQAEPGLVDLLTKGDNHVLQVSGATLTFFAGGWGRGECRTTLPANWLNHWHHIAGVCDGKRLFLYIDGVLAGSIVADNPADLSVLPHWYLGRNEEFPGERIFYGQLRDVMILAEPLTATEIRSIVAKGH